MKISDYSLRKLITFCWVVEQNGFGGVQAMFGLSQPTISSHIKDLEISLGFRLCKRGRSGFALTDRGQIVYKRCRAFLNSMADFESVLGELRGSLTGHLRIGVVDSTTTNEDFSIHQAIHQFFSKEQDVYLDLEVETPQLLEKALINGDIQLAIGPFPVQSKALWYKKIYEEVHGLYCGYRHPLFTLDNAAITTESITRCAMTIRPYLKSVETDNYWSGATIMASASNMEAQAMLIESGCFLGFLPGHYAKRWVEKQRMREIDHLDLQWRSPFYVATRAGTTPPLVVRAFIQEIEVVLAKTQSPAEAGR